MEMTAHDWARFWELLARTVHTGTLTEQERADLIRENAQANGTQTDRDLLKFVALPFGY
jgi:hypothetical protein